MTYIFHNFLLLNMQFYGRYPRTQERFHKVGSLTSKGTGAGSGSTRTGKQTIIGPRMRSSVTQQRAQPMRASKKSRNDICQHRQKNNDLYFNDFYYHKLGSRYFIDWVKMNLQLNRGKLNYAGFLINKWVSVENY